jgi:hypothetical protein
MMATEEKPSRNEDEYFARINADLIKERRFFGSMFSRRNA